MSGTVISTSMTAGLTLSTSSQNPVTITQTGAIVSADADAIDGISLASAWTIGNSGTLESFRQGVAGGSTYGAGDGIALAGNGTIENGAAAYIYGSKNGIYFAAAGSVDNTGTINGGRYGVVADGAVSITNGSKAETSALISGGSCGVFGIYDGSELTNFGTIEGAFLAAVNFGDAADATVVNGSETDTAADIAGNSGGIVLESGTIENYGTVTTGPLEVSNYGIALLGNGLIANYGLIEGGAGVLLVPGGTLINSGTIDADTASAHAIYIDGGTTPGATKLVLDQGSEISGIVQAQQNVTMELAAGDGQGTITGIGTQYIGIPDIAIGTDAAWVISGDAAGLAAGQIISGFNNRDTLYLQGFEATSSSFSNGELTLSNGHSTETLIISAVTESPAFQVSATPDATEITLCFLHGTRITTDAGDVAIEDLAIGDAVVTRFGGVRRIKFLGWQSYDFRFAKNNPTKMPVRIAAGALGDNLPRRDLFVSPGHSILLGGQLVLAQFLVNGVTVTQGEAPARIDYIHIELESHDCVLAEGCWAESYADGPGLRAQYHNAAAFHALYPDYITPDSLQLCAPRPAHGPDLEAALLPVLLRAAALQQPGRLRGFIDQIKAGGMIEGWAQDDKHPELPVVLAVLYQGAVIGIAMAREYREDLARAGLGSGRCCFHFRAPQGLVPHDVMICRVADGALLLPEAGLQARLAA